MLWLTSQKLREVAETKARANEDSQFTKQLSEENARLQATLAEEMKKVS